MKHLLLASTLILSAQAYAITCPDAAQIKSGEFREWQAANIDSDDPATPEMIEYFREHVSGFDQADWMPGTRFPSQCYYQLNDQQGYSQVFLGRSDLTAEPKGEYWSTKIPGALKFCRKGIQACKFPDLGLSG